MAPAPTTAIFIYRILRLHRATVAPDGVEVESRRSMDEEAFNMSVRKFLKKLGVTAQREIEIAVREQLDAGDLKGDEHLEAKATVTVNGLSRDVVVDGSIELS
jgi:hypothetical protein